MSSSDYGDHSQLCLDAGAFPCYSFPVQPSLVLSFHAVEDTMGNSPHQEPRCNGSQNHTLKIKIILLWIWKPEVLNRGISRTMLPPEVPGQDPLLSFPVSGGSGQFLGL